MVDQAIYCMENDPEKSLDLLNHVKTGLLNDEQYARFTIAEARTRDWLDMPAISDTALFNARDFFIDRQNAPYAALACYVSGNTCFDQQKNVNALHNYLLADKWAEKAGYKIPGMHYSSIPYNLAVLCLSNDNFIESIPYAKQAIYFIEKEKEDSLFIIHAYEIIGMNYKELELPDSALIYYNKAASMLKHKYDKETHIRLLHNSAEALIDQKKYSDAKQFCMESMSQIEPKNQIALGQEHLTLSNIYFHTGKLDSASIMGNKAKELLFQAENRILIALYNHLKNLEEKKGNKEVAAEYQKQYEHYKKLQKNDKTLIQNRLSLFNSSLNILFNRENENRMAIQKALKLNYILGIIAIISLIGITYLLYQLLTFRKKSEQEINLLVENQVQDFQEQLKKDTDNLKKTFEKNLRENRKEIISKRILLYNQFKNEKDQLKNDILAYKEEIENEFKSIQKAVQVEIIKSIFQCRDLVLLQEYVENECNSKEKFELIEMIESMLKKSYWEEMYPLLDINYGNLFLNLKIDFPMFKELEYRVCCLMCADFTTGEIADILRTNTERVEEVKHSIQRTLQTCGLTSHHLDNYSDNFNNNRFQEFRKYSISTN